jgi:hypothetical protein
VPPESIQPTLRKISVFGKRWPETWFDRDWWQVAVGDFDFASCFQFNFAGTSFDSCQEAGEPDGSTPPTANLLGLDKKCLYFGPNRALES